MSAGDVQVRILRVVLASPGDVTTERNSVDEVLTELNRGVAAALGVRFELARWETDAFPGFHVDGPQGLIDPILQVDECDLLVGIFWKRFGTPTARAPSGTIHEFQTAWRSWVERGRPQMMVYFNKKPYAPSSTAELDQWRQVLEFQQEFPKEGLWWSYNGPRQFERLFRNHLTQFIRRLNPIELRPSANAGLLTSASEIVRHEAPSLLLSQIGVEIQKIVKLVVDSETARGRSTRPGCPELFGLYQALQQLLNTSRNFMKLLGGTDLSQNLASIVECHNEFSKSFDRFAAATERCVLQLEIFDHSVAESLAEVLGQKRERVRFWQGALVAEAKRIDTGQITTTLLDDSDPWLRPVFDFSDPGILLNDSVAIKNAIEDGQDRIAALDNFAKQLAAVIKSRCDFADLFRDEAR